MESIGDTKGLEKEIIEMAKRRPLFLYAVDNKNDLRRNAKLAVDMKCKLDN